MRNRGPHRPGVHARRGGALAPLEGYALRAGAGEAGKGRDVAATIDDAEAPAAKVLCPELVIYRP